MFFGIVYSPDFSILRHKLMNIIPHSKIRNIIIEIVIRETCYSIPFLLSLQMLFVHSVELCITLIYVFSGFIL